MNQLTRRELLQAVTTCVAIPTTSVSKPAEAEDDTPKSWEEWSTIMAEMELRAIQSQYPTFWRKVGYECAIRWGENTLLFVFVGRPAIVKLRASEVWWYLSDFKDTETVADVGGEPTGRVLVIFWSGKVSPDVLEGLPKGDLPQIRPNWIDDKPSKPR